MSREEDLCVISDLCQQVRDRDAEINKLREAAGNCKDDFNYLLTITENKNGLHDWLRMRAARVGAIAVDACGCRQGECESKLVGCRIAVEVAQRGPDAM